MIILQIPVYYIGLIFLKKSIDKAASYGYNIICKCGSDSVVECHLAKVKVASSNLVFRSRKSVLNFFSTLFLVKKISFNRKKRLVTTSLFSSLFIRFLVVARTVFRVAAV